MNLLYLHGFASSPHGSKATALKRRLEPQGFGWSAPDLNAPSFAELDFDAMVARAAEAVSVAPPSVVVGSSLGALVALGLAAAGCPAPLVLVAPALGFGPRWGANLPDGDPVEFFHYGEGRPQLIHRRFFLAMRELAVDRDPPAVPVTIFMGSDDTSVPFPLVDETWTRWERSGRLAADSRFVTVPGGDHSLISVVDDIADELVRRAGGN